MAFMVTMRTTAKFYKPEEAERVANEMNVNSDDDWTYSAKHDPKGTGYSLVAIHDEDGEFVEYWGN